MRYLGFLTMVFGVIPLLGIACGPMSGVHEPPTPSPPWGERVVTILVTARDCVTERPLANATVKAEYSEGGILWGLTDQEGMGSMAVPLGGVNVTVSKTGYAWESFYANLTTERAILRFSASLCPKG